MIARIFTFLQTLPSTVFIFFVFRFILAMLPMLVFIFLEQMREERPLIPHVSHLFFGEVLLFAFPGLIMGTGSLPSSRHRSEPAMLTSNEKSNQRHADHSPVSL
jgi:hypothetical protein